MKIYNTLTKRKEDFVPLNGNSVHMYACGITVSGDAHIGHAYQALIYDIIRKYLQKKGYDVTYARNYTDVDDKIITRSRETGIPADEYAEMMIKKIDAEMRALKVDDPDIWLKATATMQGIEDFISELIKKGHAYATPEGDVYFAVDSFPGYGKLSGRNLEDARESVRIENEENKRNPLDFALWKSAKPGEPFWHSPWGDGRPGWHIECSAMNMQAFGEQIDIHGGGRDLIFPHHENEIAQTEALTGKQFAKYWIHNGLIKVNGQKMSKSLGNSLLLCDLLEKYSPEVIKFALLQTNYRGDINVTDSLFPEAEKHMLGFYRVLADAKRAGAALDGVCAEIDRGFDSAMDDDFNTAKALADLFGIPGTDGEDLFPARAVRLLPRRVRRRLREKTRLGGARERARPRQKTRGSQSRKGLGDGGCHPRRTSRYGLGGEGHQGWSRARKTLKTGFIASFLTFGPPFWAVRFVLSLRRAQGPRPQKKYPFCKLRTKKMFRLRLSATERGAGGRRAPSRARKKNL